MSRPRGRPRNIMCMICGKKMEKTDNKFYIATENPYTNIPVHLHCYKKTSKKSLKTKLNKYFRAIYGDNWQLNPDSATIIKEIRDENRKKRSTKGR